ncbi:protein fem-1 homolog CG6966 [Hyposmocoma kahamanoa]|uniref:protein fem-1 homolog CG6966 n=1 Tax=Hyposmocoma kahamanoa TaxID=1477025 RepID=UPI000E6D8C64|nr:protein fem-1 homolog CG6966 [Hyposmocoma kahamanoa]
MHRMMLELARTLLMNTDALTFDGETIEGAPPLWCAAAAGHLPLVRLLIRAGANVNSTTRTQSTPLRAACFDGHYDIVKFLVENGADIEIANRHGHTCLMIACYKGRIRIAKYLLSLNADVNRKSVKGNTALHDCAESGSLHIMRMLLEHGATMDVDSYGMTPLLAASVTGHTHIVEHLINLEHGLVTRQQRIDALELLGATYVDKRRDMVGALALWKRAMDDRFPTDGSEPIPKPKDIPRIEAYDYAVEPSDAQQLDELLADPDAMRMQALVIRERILGPAHPDTSYYVRYRGAVYADAGRFSRCRQLWHHALDMQRTVLPPLSPLTQSSLYSFAELFSYMLGERARPPLRGTRPQPDLALAH